MLSAYFKLKIESKKFKDDLKWSIGEIKDKKILLYGAGEGFAYLLDKYDFKKLNVVAIADMKFKVETTWNGFKAIAPEEIKNQDYDVIMITNEYAAPIVRYLKNDLCIENKDIRTVFNEELVDEKNSINYLEQYDFGKNLKKLEKKLKGKKVVIYGGAGIIFQTISTFYDLGGFDVIGISDRKFAMDDAPAESLGYKTVAPDKIKDLNPDYVLVATKFFINIIEDLEYNLLKGTKIKVKPMIKKPFWTLWKEIWG
jgi:hypothetical protein